MAKKSRFGSLNLLLLVCVGLTSVVPQTWAATYVVDRFDDDPGASTCSFFTANDCSLRGAILKANLGSNLDELLLTTGSYTLTQPGRDENLAATGDLDVLHDLTIKPLVPGATVVIDGGGIDRVFHIRGSADVTIRRMTLLNGSVLGDAGGAVYVDFGTTLVLENSTIADSEAGWGGGINNFGTLDIIASTIEGNHATGFGGGIYNQGGMTMTDTTVGLFNSATKGGGLYNTGNPATLIRSTFWANSASEDGGGIFNSNGMSMKSCSIFLNYAPYGRGGGIFNEHWLTIINVTLTANICGSASNSSAIYSNGGDLMLADNIIQGTCVPSTGNVSYGGNLESPGNSCGLIHPDDQTGVADPLLGTANFHGGLTVTWSLEPNSPAIEAAGGGCTPYDQRNRTRPIDGNGGRDPLCDAGAYEYDPAEILVDSFESGGTGAWN